MRKFISLLLAMILILSLGVTSFAQISDLENHWAKEAINYLVEKGVLIGYPDGTFRPDNPMSKAEFYKVINELLGFDEKGEVTYLDVFPKDWFYDHIARALAAGYISPATFLSPNENITREEVARIIGVVYKIGHTSTSATIFSDSSLIPKEILGYIGTMVDKGILNGYPDGSFRPGANITRAEVVTIINNVSKILNDIVQESVDKSELEALLEEAEDLDKNDYTKTTWNKLKEVLELAIEINDNEDATQVEVDEVYEKLVQAIDNLKKVSNSTSSTGRDDDYPPVRPQTQMIASPATVQKYSRLSESFTLSIVNDTILSRVYIDDIVLGGVFEGLYRERVSTINNKTIILDVFGNLNKFGTGTITLKGSALNSGKPITAKVTVDVLPVYNLGTSEPNNIKEPVQLAPANIVGDVVINYEPFGDLDLPEGLSIEGNLIIDAPNATINNYAAVSREIIVKDVALNTWNEYADGNNIVIDDENGLELIIIGDIGGITISESAGGNILVYISDDANVDTIESITINKPIILYLPESIKATIKAGIKVTVYSTSGPFIYELTGTGEQLEIEMPANMIKVSSIAVVGAGNENKMMIGETLQMSAAILPDNASYKHVIWSVENGTGSATIDANGLLTGTGTGKVIVKAKAIDDSRVYGEKEIIIEESRVKVTGITLDQTSLVLGVGGESGFLRATLSPSDATIRDIIWTSSNESVARVYDYNGQVVPMGLGTATITAKSKDGGFVATCEVEVKVTEIKEYVPILEVDAGRAGSAKYTSAADVIIAALPERLAIKGNSGSVPVIWSETSTPEYDATKAGTYIFTGTIGELPEGYVDAIDTISRIAVVVVVAPKPKQYTLTLTGAKVSSNPAPGLIDENTEVTVTVSLKDGQSISSLWVNNYIIDNLVENENNKYTYTFPMTKDTTVNSIIKLAKVPKPTWTGTIISWETVDDAKYAVFVYKDGEEVWVSTVDADTLSSNMDDAINRNGLGSYTVIVRANPVSDAGFTIGDLSLESDALTIEAEDDKSEFILALVEEGPKTIGVPFNLSITDAKEILGTPLDHGRINVIIKSDNEEGILFEKILNFKNGVPTEPISITLSKGEHILTVQVQRITNPQTITVIVE